MRRNGLLRGSRFLGNSEVPKEVWKLFKSMLDNVDKDVDKVYEVENVCEIVQKALEGKIDMNSEFKLKAYNETINMGKRRNAVQKMKKETFIDFFSSDEDKYTNEVTGGVTIDVVSFQADTMSEAKSDYDCILDNAELISAINNIKALNEDFIVEYQVDLISLIKKAVQGIPQAVVKLREICEEVSCVGEQVKIILSSGVSISECFG